MVIEVYRGIEYEVPRCNGFGRTYSGTQKNYGHPILNETDEKPPHCLLVTAQTAEREFRVLFSDVPR